MRRCCRTAFAASTAFLWSTSPVNGVRLANDEDDGGKRDVWKEATDFLKSKKHHKGTHVNDKLTSADTEHGGQTVRGIVTKEAMKKSAKNDKSTQLLRIPKKSWMTLDNFPEMRDSKLDCSDNAKELKMCTAIAIEAKKGKDSAWDAYLATLPTYNDFHSFYPRWAEAELLDEFAGLELTDTMGEMQKDEAKVKQCWDNWRSSANAKAVNGIGSTKWDDVRLALARWRTRNHNITDSKGNYSHALLPAADLMNTGIADEINTNWWFEDTDGDGDEDTYILDIKKDVQAGEELYESYCPTCSNTWMLMSWGIYVENNNVETDNIPQTCQSLSGRIAEYLDKDDFPAGLRSPRCKPTTFKLVQGPMRCAFARLAYEACQGPSQPDGKGEEAQGDVGDQQAAGQPEATKDDGSGGGGGQPAPEGEQEGGQQVQQETQAEPGSEAQGGGAQGGEQDPAEPEGAPEAGANAPATVNTPAGAHGAVLEMARPDALGGIPSKGALAEKLRSWLARSQK
eukprot:TRINITY_DN110788_c0_g1_i1.p1 TRINITY_DN110788_c0_g1~~TRINITY_DN110788_c0_g1_i1.p1  ORF type:complete len:511 (-),score=113.87 TRINITY_DN110788_c0_g1_i1:132-1664(-)